MLFVAGAELPQPGVIAVLYRVPAGLCIPAGDAGAQQQRRLQNSEPGGYAMYLLAVVCRGIRLRQRTSHPDSFCSLLLVVGQPLNPLPPSGAVVVLVCLLQRIRVLLAVLVLVEVNRLYSAGYSAAAPAARLCPRPAPAMKVSKSISPVLIATVRQRFKSRLPPSFAPCSFPTPLKSA